MEIVTKSLGVSALASQIDPICEFCARHSPETVMVSYGWGCRLEIDDLWQGRPVPTTGLRAFIRESIERGVFPLGDGDLFIEAPSKLFRFQICHESDLHFRSEEPLLVDDVRSRWASAGIEVPAV